MRARVASTPVLAQSWPWHSRRLACKAEIHAAGWCVRSFELLTRVRIARHFGQLEGRRRLARVRLLAFYVLFQSSPSHDDMMAFFVSEAEFVSELVGLLQACLPPA